MVAPQIVIRNGLEGSWYQHKKQVWLFTGKGVDGITHRKVCAKAPRCIQGLSESSMSGKADIDGSRGNWERESRWVTRSDGGRFASGYSYLNTEVLGYFLKMLSPSPAPFHLPFLSSSFSFIPSLPSSLSLKLSLSPLWKAYLSLIWLCFACACVLHEAEHSYVTAAVGDSDDPKALVRWRHFIFFASGPNPSLYYPCGICLPWGLYTWFVLFLSRLKYHSPPCFMPSAWHEWRISTSCLAPSFLLLGSWQEMNEREGRLGISSILLDCGQKEWSMKNTVPADGTVWSS